MRRLAIVMVLGSLLVAACTASQTTGTAADVRESDQVVWAIGDSIMVGAETSLAELNPDMVIDAEVGRSFAQGLDVLAERLTASPPPNVLVFALGTNNGATEGQIARLAAMGNDIDDIVLVNVVVPRGWQDATNLAIRQAAGLRDNVSFVDWYSAAQGRSELFRSDGYHPNDLGRQQWVDLIAAATS